MSAMLMNVKNYLIIIWLCIIWLSQLAVAEWGLTSVVSSSLWGSVNIDYGLKWWISVVFLGDTMVFNKSLLTSGCRIRTAYKNRMGTEFQDVTYMWRKDDTVLNAKRYGADLKTSRVSFHADFCMEEFTRRKEASVKKAVKLAILRK
jgi:hypothetical protein